MRTRPLGAVDAGAATFVAVALGAAALGDAEVVVAGRLRAVAGVAVWACAVGENRQRANAAASEHREAIWVAIGVRRFGFIGVFLRQGMNCGSRAQRICAHISEG